MTPAPPDDLMSDLYECFRGVRSLLLQVFTKYDLTLTHVQALKVLARNESLTMSHLTECMHVTPGASTGIIDRLCKQGLVERQHAPDDRRVVHVVLTPAGRELSQAIHQELRTEFGRVHARLDETAQQTVMAGLSKLAQAFAASPSHPQGEWNSCSK